MLIDLTKIPVAYINLDKDFAKRSKMEELLSGYKDVTRIEATYIKDNGVKALAESQKAAVASISVPGLVLEDDCVKANYRTTINVPDDADIVFLGIWQLERPAIPSGKYLPAYESINEEIARVYTMHGSHAILYVSELGKKIASQAYEIASRTELWNDAILNRALPFIKAYAVKQPIFYQTSNEIETNISYPDEFIVVDEDFLSTLITSPRSIESI